MDPLKRHDHPGYRKDLAVADTSAGISCFAGLVILLGSIIAALV